MAPNIFVYADRVRPQVTNYVRLKFSNNLRTLLQNRLYPIPSLTMMYSPARSNQICKRNLLGEEEPQLVLFF